MATGLPSFAGSPDLSKIPLMPPPPGVQSNFVDPPSRAGSLIATVTLCLFLATVFVVLRLYVRLVMIRIFGISDYLLLAGYGFAVANSALALASIPLGFGRHGWDVPFSNTTAILKLIWWQPKTYVVSLCFTKIAILCIYPQLSPSKPFRMCVWALAGLVACSSLVSLIWSICACLPIQNSWNMAALAAGKCPLTVNFVYYTGAMNIATDVAILVLPIFMLRRVSLSRKKKIGVVLILATGSLASLISIIRVILSVRSGWDQDATYVNVILVVWSFSELYAGIICACLPTLRPLARYLPSMLGSFAETSRRTNPTNRNDSKPNTKGPFLERVTMSKEGQRTRDDSSEEYILNDRIIVTMEYNVTAGRVHDVDIHGKKAEVV